MTTHPLYIEIARSVEEAKLFFEAHSLSALPVCEEGLLVGVLSKNTIAEEDEEALISEYRYAFDHYSVSVSTSWDAVMEAFAVHRTDMLPVVDEAQHLIGCYQLRDFVLQLAETPFIKETGRVLILEKDAHSYSFAEIAQIVESNHSQLLGLYISNYHEDTVLITVKLITDALSEVLQTFRRYGYGILSEKEDDLYREELKNIANYFDKYINL